MCGFTGFWETGLNGEDPERILHRMNVPICHRGPDDEGYWFDSRHGIGFAHRRLAIIDLTAEGHQPKASESGRFVIAYNGEIYNFPHLRDELRSLGHSFRGTSDTEVALAAFEEWGIADATNRFAGMFAFAAWDSRSARLSLVRDRMGEKPVYYGWFGTTLLFGSELKALRAHPAWRGTVDRTALAGFMRYSYVPGPDSIYTGIKKLPPGSIMSWSARDGAVTGSMHQYWSAKAAAERGLAAPFQGAATELTSRFDSLLRDVISAEMVSDVPLGAFLSGGIDSSTVVAIMQATHARPVRTFTIGFHESGYNEAEHARAVAAHLGTEHTELYVTAGEAQEVIPRLPQLFDEPFADPSQIPTFLVAALARRHVTVSLSGDGGDELFGGYNRYAIGRSLWSRMKPVPRFLRRGVASAVQAVTPATWDRIGEAARHALPRRWQAVPSGDKLHKFAHILAVDEPEAIYRSLVGHWQNADRVVLGVPRSSENVDGLLTLGGGDFVSRMMYSDTISYLPDDILVKVDRATMGVSLESRAPFLDHRVFEFAWHVPMEFKLRDGVGKWLLRQVLYKYVPRSLVERPKMGFGVPIDTWLRGPLRDWGESLLSPDRLAREGFFDVAAIRAKWDQHQSGIRNWQYLLWDALMFQAWNETA